MSGTIWVVLVVLTLAAGLFIFRAVPGIWVYFGYRGKRLVSCPETHKAAAVDVAAGEAAVGAFLSEPTLRLKDCSRWPERAGCGQDCLGQVEVDPENCLVWNIVSKWYEGKKCAVCQKPIGKLRHLDHAPGLLDAEHRTVEWKQLRPEQLPEVFSTCRPVCWNCHVTALFLRMHPELVTVREPEAGRLR